MKNTAVIPRKITRKYWMSRGMRYRFMNAKAISSSIFPSVVGKEIPPHPLSS
jgi:hypothetical protein